MAETINWSSKSMKNSLIISPKRCLQQVSTKTTTPLSHEQAEFFQYLIALAEKHDCLVSAIITKEGIYPQILSDGRENQFAHLMADQQASLEGLLPDGCPKENPNCQSFQSFEEFKKHLDEPSPIYPMKTVVIDEVLEPAYAARKITPGMTGIFTIFKEESGIYQGNFSPDISHKIGPAHTYYMKARLTIMRGTNKTQTSDGRIMYTVSTK